MEKVFQFCIVFYIPLVFICKFQVDKFSQEKKKKLCDLLEKPWMIWCFCLSVFSFFGAVNTLFAERNIWYIAFIYSKIPELLDTFFVIFRSKKLVSLQWYHHWATMTICYFALKYSCDSYTIFFFMNYSVHFFMYLYYALYPIFRKELKHYGTFVNILQTLQMFFAVLLSAYFYSIEYYGYCLKHPTVEENKQLFIIGFLMYVSYLYLFISLFFERGERLKRNE